MNIDFVSIPEQTFSMGSSDLEIIDCTNQWASRLLDSRYSEEVFRSWLYKEFPSHSVTLRNFFIGKYPITNAQYKKFVMATGGRAPESFQTFGQDDHPVWGVELDEARGFADWASACLGRDIRLPTEAEWELAARGPLRTEYPYGNEFDLTKANTFETGIGKTTSVKAYEAWASGFGVVDLAGNVEEWVDTTYFVYPGGKVVEDDLYRNLGPNYPILRGGSFARGGDLSRSARRHGPFKADVYRFTGFRVAYSR